MTEETKKEEVPAVETPKAPAAEPAFVITQEELDRLVGTVKAKSASESVDTKAIYEKAMAEIRAELEKTQKAQLEASAREAERERIARLEKELADLKNSQTRFGPRKGLVDTTNPFQKSNDGKLGIRTDALEEATRRMLNPGVR